MTALVFAAGWLVGAASLAFGLGALLGWIDRNDPPAPPTTVRDPETGALWTEYRRVDTYA